MAKLDFMKIFQLVGVAMAAVERVKASGPDKEAAVIDTIMDALPEVEGILGQDLVQDERLRSLLSNYVAAKKALVNGIADAKGLRVKPEDPPVTPAYPTGVPIP